MRRYNFDRAALAFRVVISPAPYLAVSTCQLRYAITYVLSRDRKTRSFRRSRSSSSQRISRFPSSVAGRSYLVVRETGFPKGVQKAWGSHTDWRRSMCRYSSGPSRYNSRPSAAQRLVRGMRHVRRHAQPPPQRDQHEQEVHCGTLRRKPEVPAPAETALNPAAAIVHCAAARVQFAA